MRGVVLRVVTVLVRTVTALPVKSSQGLYTATYSYNSSHNYKVLQDVSALIFTDVQRCLSLYLSNINDIKLT